MLTFLVLFYILDQGYDYCKEDLGGFLGAISPELWEDGQPADKAVLCDWQKITVSEKVDLSNIIEKGYDFLGYYEQEFGFDFSTTKQWLLTITNKSMVEKAYVKAQIMYQKYHYDD